MTLLGQPKLKLTLNSPQQKCTVTIMGLPSKIKVGWFYLFLFRFILILVLLSCCPVVLCTYTVYLYIRLNTILFLEWRKTRVQPATTALYTPGISGFFRSDVSLLTHWGKTYQQWGHDANVTWTLINYMMFTACLPQHSQNPTRTNRSSGLIRNSYLLNKQMFFIDNSWLGLANTQDERFTPFLVIKIKGNDCRLQKWQMKNCSDVKTDQSNESGLLIWKTSSKSKIRRLCFSRKLMSESRRSLNVL
jgi:hypothetical protein